MTEKEQDTKIKELETRLIKMEKLVGGIMQQMTMAALMVD